MSEPLTDSMLVQRASRGDSIAFSELVNRHYRRAVRVAYGLLRNRRDAEEVVQEAFARVHFRLRDFGSASAFYTWLYRNIVSRCHYLTQQRRKTAWRPPAPIHAAGLWSQDNEAERLGEQLQQAVYPLSETAQAAYFLRELEAFTYDEIAGMLRLSRAAVTQRIFQARKSMQSRLLALAGKGKKAAPEGSSS